MEDTVGAGYTVELGSGTMHLQKIVDANLRDGSSEKALRSTVHTGRDEKTCDHGVDLYVSIEGLVTGEHTTI